MGGCLSSDHHNHRLARSDNIAQQTTIEHPPNEHSTSSSNGGGATGADVGARASTITHDFRRQAVIVNIRQRDSNSGGLPLNHNATSSQQNGPSNKSPSSNGGDVGTSAAVPSHSLPDNKNITPICGNNGQNNNTTIPPTTSSGNKCKLKLTKIRWSSNDLITESQLRRRRESFWDTAPTYEGRPEIWAALRTAAEALDAHPQDLALAQAVLEGAGVQLGPDSSLTDCWDERGNHYRIPLYCLGPPTNLLSNTDLASSSSSSSSANVIAAATAVDKNDDAEVTTRIAAAAKPPESSSNKINHHASVNNTASVAAEADDTAKANNHTNNNIHIQPPAAAANVVDTLFNPENMMTIKLRFHYCNNTVASSNDEKQHTATPDPHDPGKISTRSRGTSSSSTATAAATKKSSSSKPAVDEPPPIAVMPQPPPSPSIVVPTKDTKFPVSLLETVSSAKRRVRDKYLHSLLPHSSEWRVQHWFYAGRLLNDKQPINTISMLLKNNCVIQVIIRERDMQLHRLRKSQRSIDSNNPAGKVNQPTTTNSDKISTVSKLIRAVVSRPNTPAVPAGGAAAGMDEAGGGSSSTNSSCRSLGRGANRAGSERNTAAATQSNSTTALASQQQQQQQQQLVMRKPSSTSSGAAAAGGVAAISNTAAAVSSNNSKTSSLATTASTRPNGLMTLSSTSAAAGDQSSGDN